MLPISFYRSSHSPPVFDFGLSPSEPARLPGWIFFLDLFPRRRDLFSRSSAGQWSHCSWSLSAVKFSTARGFVTKAQSCCRAAKAVAVSFFSQRDARSIFPCWYFRFAARRWILASLELVLCSKHAASGARSLCALALLFLVFSSSIAVWQTVIFPICCGCLQVNAGFILWGTRLKTWVFLVLIVLWLKTTCQSVFIVVNWLVAQFAWCCVFAVILDCLIRFWGSIDSL
jgi:hypothetical protein